MITNSEYIDPQGIAAAGDPTVGIPSRVGAALMLLLEAHAYAHDVTEDAWEFSVEWSELRRLGLTANDGRWLVRKGLVKPAHETTAADDTRRTFVPSKGTTFSTCTCLTLTERGLEFARQLSEPGNAALPEDRSGMLGVLPGSALTAHAGLSAPRANDGVLMHRPTDAPAVANGHPQWDRHRRELRVAGSVVKEFKVPAPNQEIVLEVFEEEHWPPRIDDPLPPKPGIDAQRRLHDTINSLNRNQRQRLIRFFADGLGKGVRWVLRAEFAPPAPALPDDRP